MYGHGRFLAGILVFVCACNGVIGDGDGADADDPSGVAAEQLAGEYELVSQFDLTTSGLLPDLASDTLHALSSLRESPSRTMLEILQAADVPIVATVLAAIPESIRSVFEDLIDTYFFDQVFEAVPFAERVTGMIDDVSSLVTDFRVVSTLVLEPADDDGITKATHSVAGIAFSFDGVEHIVLVPDLVADVTKADSVDASAAHLFEASNNLEDGRFNLGAHSLDLPVGDLAIAGSNVLLAASLGADDLRAALDVVVDCDGMAKSVAETCVTGICIGHEVELAEMCHSGLDYVVAEVEDALAQIRFELVQFTAGEAAMFDAPEEGGELDGVIDRIERGNWDIAIGSGDTTVTIRGTFSGRRIRDDAEEPASFQVQRHVIVGDGQWSAGR